MSFAEFEISGIVHNALKSYFENLGNIGWFRLFIAALDDMVQVLRLLYLLPYLMNLIPQLIIP